MSLDIIGGLLIGAATMWAISRVSRKYILSTVRYQIKMYGQDMKLFNNIKKQHKSFMNDLSELVGDNI